jgi:hypothetical protein
MLRTLSPDILAHESTQTVEKANHLIATLRISRAYLMFCTLMSLLSSSLLMYSVMKLAKHGVDGLKMHTDWTEELMELAVCGGILVEMLWALRLMPLRVVVRVKLLQLDICVFFTASISAALASASLAEHFAISARQEFLRGASAALFLFRFLLQPVRAALAMRNAWQLSRERKVAMEDIILPEIPPCRDDFSPVALTEMTSNPKAGFLVCASESQSECV